MAFSCHISLTHGFMPIVKRTLLVLFIMANEGAISIAIHESKPRFDVFLSFRGKDTRHTFTGYLYNDLRRNGLNTFMDDEVLKSGDQISLALVKAIEESRISIIVFSKNYAYSSWCLDELVMILECMKKKDQLIWPIFYKVNPSDIRHQRNSYGKAMAAHENRFRNDIKKVHKWRSALFEVANLKGWHFKTGYEYEFIQRIVNMATAKLHRELDVGEKTTLRRDYYNLWYFETLRHCMTDVCSHCCICNPYPYPYPYPYHYPNNMTCPPSVVGLMNVWFRGD